ncbi:hypothetical protein [Nonomuraea sp. NPDC050783]|uniref:hypothetical protein n=1 Tax=Nonomuraea sp. NPDC050783 TaxID=3154634 RepID=UPI003465E7F4
MSRITTVIAVIAAGAATAVLPLAVAGPAQAEPVPAAGPLPPGPMPGGTVSAATCAVGTGVPLPSPSSPTLLTCFGGTYHGRPVAGLG